MNPLFVADVGGTRTRFAIAGVDNKKIKILVREEFSTKTLKDFKRKVRDFIGEHRVASSVVAVAGPRDREKRRISLTNAPLTIKEQDLPGSKRILLNDAEALAYATELPNLSTNLFGRKRKGRKAIITVGTGLGHSIAEPHEESGIIVLTSEAGHAPFPLFTTEEHGLSVFCNALEGASKKRGITAEQILSGRGLECIHSFIRASRYPAEPKKDAREIMESKSACARATRTLFKQLLARWCQSFTLTSMSVGGLFLSGGVLHKELFDKDFSTLFSSHHKKEYQELLAKVPLALFKPDATLFGAANALQHHLRKNKKNKKE